MRLNMSRIAVPFPAMVTAIFKPFGGTSQALAFMLFGIHPMKYEEFLFPTFDICSSTSFVDIRPHVARISSAHHNLGVAIGRAKHMAMCRHKSGGLVRLSATI